MNLSRRKLDEWRKTYSSYFNSIFITNSDGVLQFVSPLDQKSKVQPGTKITSDLMKQALKNQETIYFCTLFSTDWKINVACILPHF